MMFAGRLSLLLFVCFIYVARADDQPVAVSPDDRAKALAESLKSPDDTIVMKATQEIQSFLESDPDGTIGYFRKYWIDALASTSRFDLAEEMALRGILAAPWRTGDVDFLQETRVRMLLRTGHADEALSNARSLFEVASLHDTERSLVLMTECMKAVHGDDASMLRAFRKEQIRGAATRPIDQPEPTSPMMDAIPIDPAPYEAAIKQLVSDDDQSRTAKGNLLLLAGRPDEAKKLFELMLRSSDLPDRVGLAENVARAIKASDGTIGRANQYMISEVGGN
jgi:tetratricopeptide (TPR) repeat protein